MKIIKPLKTELINSAHSRSDGDEEDIDDNDSKRITLKSKMDLSNPTNESKPGDTANMFPTSSRLLNEPSSGVLV